MTWVVEMYLAPRVNRKHWEGGWFNTGGGKYETREKAEKMYHWCIDMCYKRSIRREFRIRKVEKVDDKSGTEGRS